MRSTIALHPRNAKATVYETRGYPGEPNVCFKDDDGNDLTIYLRSQEELLQLRDAIDAYLAAPKAEAA